ncbi:MULTISPECIES: SprT family protein [Thermoactinomyces]|jgi:SprT-like protein|uniref:SprT family protein n=1 Tax=Thermoactinomyces daqus TaxID=1329516 RepID=A0A7W1XCI1_9BACL|nr:MULTISPECIES: SprT family protein [Thermoactinomyces]MBA4544144.1 SprT family protein [Thermoactinomyces daqus]MBH8599532.1 SprT family protein [Thermoactinomyces sp. CICC 10523]MBH8605451.1 SprT family protein [Thermoactinomyces sp. CICC 10522]MBH8608955.1 SprT family protein [Thermoactinomyces sp. CICC 10521]
MAKWTDQELQKRVETLSLQHFGLPFRHLARFNPRLRTTGGRYCLGSHAIEMNPRYLEEHGEEIFQKMILHELCHYHLHLQGKGYQHRDADFRYWLQRVGGLRHAPALQSLQSRKPKYVLICVECRQVYYRQRRVDLRKYRCGVCRGPLKLRQSNSD